MKTENAQLKLRIQELEKTIAELRKKLSTRSREDRHNARNSYILSCMSEDIWGRDSMIADRFYGTCEDCGGFIDRDDDECSQCDGVVW